MKPTALIPPAVVVLAGTIWLTIQSRTISRVEQENAILSKRIAARSSVPGDSTLTHEKPRRSTNSTAKDKEPIDWKAVAEQFTEMQRSGGMGDMKTMVRFQGRLQAMSSEELIAALDEIAALGFPDQTRFMLESMLLGSLVGKDPQLALDRFAPRAQENQGMLAWQLSHGLRQWAEKDLAQATAWFDRQIAAGTFDSKSLDGRSQSRLAFEGSLVAVLLTTDPAAAAKRLAALPEAQRKELLANYQFANMKEKDQPAFASLVRSQLPANDQAGAIADAASHMVANDGYEKVTAYLDRIAATPAERAATVEKSAATRLFQLSQSKKVTTAEIDDMRAWAETQSPGSADKATGSALARLGDRSTQNFTENANLALQYHESTGNDEVLATFLESYTARNHKDISRPLAEKITDEKRRAAILEKLK